MRWVALLSVRGGSAPNQRETLRPIAGRPLYTWSLEAALDSGCFERVVVASDSPEVRDDAWRRYGARIEVIDQATASAGDVAGTESVMLELTSRETFDVLALIQATSPLTRAEDFRDARAQFERDALDSLLTGVAQTRFVWTPDGRALDHDPMHRPRRDEFPGTIVENGAFSFTRRDLLLGNGARLGGRIGLHRMHADTAVELDDALGRSTVERLLRQRVGIPVDLRLLVVDVDGTLTDGGMYYDANGEALKKFQTRDAKGLLMLRDAGVRICIVTAENSAVVHARMRKLGLTDYFPGVSNKPAWLAEHGPRFDATLAQTAYIGDDLNDLQCLSTVGFSCCPADAVPEVRDAVHYVCNAEGGDGAVREVADLIRARLAGHASAR